MVEAITEYNEEDRRTAILRRFHSSKFLLQIVCSYFSLKGQTYMMRKLSKQFDRAVLDGTKLARAVLHGNKERTLAR